MASPALPSPVNYEDNRQPRAFPSILLTGGNGVASGIAVQNVSGKLDVPGLSVDGTALTSTPAELNVLAGVTPGTSSASKAAVLGANKNLDVLALPVGGLAIGAGAGTAVTASAAEVNALTGATAGTAKASLALVADANIALAGLNRPVRTDASTPQTLTAPLSRTVIEMNLASSIAYTLPAANAVAAGVEFLFVAKVATTSGNGHQIDPAGTDVMRGNGFTAAAGKGARHTQATSRVGDILLVISNGADAWYIAGVTGTWARTP